MNPIPTRKARRAATPGFFDSVTTTIGPADGAVGADGGIGGRGLVRNLRPQLGQKAASVGTAFPH